MNKKRGNSLLTALKVAKVQGYKEGVAGTCEIMAAIIWNLATELELTDEQRAALVNGIEPEQKRLLATCYSSDNSEQNELVEYMLHKTAEIKREVAQNEV